jgi:hypothetical protein
MCTQVRGGSSPLFGTNENKDLITSCLPGNEQEVGSFCSAIALPVHHKNTLELTQDYTMLRVLASPTLGVVKSPGLSLGLDYLECRW